MSEYALYDNDGKILQTMVSNRTMKEFGDVSPNTIIEILNKGDVVNAYVVDGSITPRPTNPVTLTSIEVAANGTDVTALANLPDSCTITYTGPGFEITKEVTGGTAEFTTDVIGLHTIKVVAFPYLDWEGTVNAV